MELFEADELIALAKRAGVKFTIGYSQRFNTKIAYAKKKIADGTLGTPGVADGEPASFAQPRQADRRPHAALTGGDGIDPRSRLRVLAARAGEAGARLFAGRLRLHEGRQRLLRHHVDHGDHGQRRAGRDRRRLEFAAELSELLRHLDRDHRHRGLAVPRRHPARQLAQHCRRRHAVSDVDHAGRAGRPRVRRTDGTGDAALPRVRSCSTVRPW